MLFYCRPYPVLLVSCVQWIDNVLQMIHSHRPVVRMGERRCSVPSVSMRIPPVRDSAMPVVRNWQWHALCVLISIHRGVSFVTPVGRIFLP
jgi:hypothetical protein